MQKDIVPQSNDKQRFNKLCRLLLATLVASTKGKTVNTQIRGTKEEIDAIKEAMLASRQFQEELHKPNATVDSVMKKLNLKNSSAAKFEKVFGISWPL
jgi:hypothetical protein